eukprot:TRINITY_DN2838_c0_g1_i1.p1 TRINITY_DN2838_c0_g1~~TRINITY_DN2838_c0_g1_i1.p1  ORF type:complete len:464 (-),score=125.21 TRINITY_DN2838_c0_g1_i1:56-1255(-)
MKVAVEIQRRENIKSYKALKILLADESKQPMGFPVVHMEKFGEVTRLFGPIQINDTEMLFDKMKAVLKENWFKLNVDRAQSNEYLKDKDPGTFLVRIGGDYQHDFVISMVSNGKICHISVNNEPGKGFTLREGSIYFKRLEQLITYGMRTNVLGQVCTGSQSFFSEPVSQVAGYAPLLMEVKSGNANFLCVDEEPQASQSKKKKFVGPHDNLALATLFNSSLSMSANTAVTTTDPNSNNSVTANPQYSEHLQRLQQRLEAYGNRMSGKVHYLESNCQFEAVAHQLFQDAKFADQVRMNVSTWLLNNPTYCVPNGQELSKYLCAGLTWQQYCQGMASPACWGDNVTLIAVAEVYQAKIVIITSIVGNQFVIEITPSQWNSNKIIKLCQIMDVYFESLQEN